MLSEPIRLTVPGYITRVQTSAARQPKYFKRTSKLPKKYQDATRYQFGVDGLLFDLTTNQRVIANLASVGTPGSKPINGQHFYKGFATPFDRIKVVTGIKDFLRPFVQTLPVLSGPLRLDVELHQDPGVANWDLDNLWIYNKCFQDLLTESEYPVGTGKKQFLMRVLPRIQDDSIRFITKAPGIEFTPVSDEKDRKLVFILSPETRPCILTHPLYAQVP